MRHIATRSVILGAAFCVALFCPGRARAQSDSPVQAERPLIEDVIFDGVQGIPRAALRDSIETQATHCRGLLLRPLCLISSSPYFVEKHHLDRDELPADELRIRVIYFRAGFREAQVSSAVTPHGDGVNVTFNITEGPATRVSELTYVQTDTVLPERLLSRALAPRAGELLDLNKIDSTQIRLRGMLWDRGYGDAVVEDSMRIDAVTHTAALRFHIDPVHLTTIDSLRIDGNEGVSDTTIVRLLGLRRGQLYKRTDMTAAQRRVYESEIFRQTLVQVEETPDSAKTVVVTVREAPFRAVHLGVGFNTTQYGQLEARLRAVREAGRVDAADR